MDDIFYMNQKKVNILKIKDIVEIIGTKRTFIPKTFDVLEIEFKNNINVCWSVMKTDDFCDPSLIKFIQKNKIKTIFCISHHPKDISFLIVHLKLILERYGGLIGNDSEGFQPIYDCNTINLFKYE